MISPTQRSLALLRRQGAMAAVVEKYNAFIPRADGGKGIRQDLFRFADILAVEPGQSGVLAVQACRMDDQTEHVAKIKAPKVWAKAVIWLGAQNRLQVWGWGKRLDTQKRQRWTLSKTEVTL